jgi:hypothetical protein
LAPVVERPSSSVFASGAAELVVVGAATLGTVVGIVVGETDAAVAGATTAGEGIVVGVLARADGQFVGAVISPEFEIA